MAHHEVQLPPDIEQGAVGGPRFKTRVLVLESGFEQRNIDWSQSRAEYDLSYGVMTLSDDGQSTYIHLIRDFFFARQGRAHSFNFKDWADYQIGDVDDPTNDNQLLYLGDDSTTVFQIYKQYTSLVGYSRTIKKIVVDRAVVLLDNVVQTEGVDYTLDDTTGLITMTVAPASTGGTGPGGEEILSVACEFLVPVRFDNDHLGISMVHAAGLGAGSIPSIPIVEVRL